MNLSSDSLALIAILSFIVLLKGISLFARITRSGRNRKPKLKAKSKSQFHHEHHIQRKNLLNKSEVKFMGMLIEAFPNHYVFPQVSFNALVTHAPYVRNFRWRNAIRSKFNTKAVDFVLCDQKTLEVVAIIEYDGTGHDYKADAFRDRLLESYRVERFNKNDTLTSIKNRFHLLLEDIDAQFVSVTKSESVQF